MRTTLNSKSFVRAATGAALLLLASCGGNGPTAPPPPAGKGQLAFNDSGCACQPKPWDPITIFVDNQEVGQLPIFGHLNVPLPPGLHTWSDNDGDGPRQVTIVAGQTISVQIFVNLGCGDSCSDTQPPPT